jgi:hypothetical protein
VHIGTCLRRIDKLFTSIDLSMGNIGKMVASRSSKAGCFGLLGRKRTQVGGSVQSVI